MASTEYLFNYSVGLAVAPGTVIVPSLFAPLTASFRFLKSLFIQLNNPGAAIPAAGIIIRQAGVPIIDANGAIPAGDTIIVLNLQGINLRLTGFPLVYDVINSVNVAGNANITGTYSLSAE